MLAETNCNYSYDVTVDDTSDVKLSVAFDNDSLKNHERPLTQNTRPS